MSESKSSSGGIGVLTALGLIFVVLKLVGVIHWSWWYVTLPFWGGLVLVIALILIALICVGAAKGIKRIANLF